jgi:hypothetical protein
MLAVAMVFCAQEDKKNKNLSMWQVSKMFSKGIAYGSGFSHGYSAFSSSSSSNLAQLNGLQQMRMSEIKSIMLMLEKQQKECQCELMAYNKVKAAYAEYRAYLLKVSMAKKDKFQASSARAMALRFMNAAVQYRKMALSLQKMSMKYAYQAKSSSSQFALYTSESKTYLN